MTYKHLLSLFTLMTLAAMFTGCAEEQSESEEHVQRRLLEAYRSGAVTENHPA